ncbi:MAG: nicotinate-nucleotide diphosphorylase (carboxylating) [Candidatus Diapherotrites archaeon CG10_big_fil_rev_8_21_14_0_10_31_34]|nr:MAG: nicotinate-nucleotide diphosphorylase (carboxylating) [Candidatus Diapherotrites archaeon CG10_big_fil_rev_8_21_14_0_10_31_34]PJA21359.1 MAG: nicotinate-nucleotide diphosphorylase (carboxylating) [Candidatus Diapherotrites archaeon CG_4_10_14_0_2_um_filter_31_5]
MISKKMKKKLVEFVREDIAGKDITTELITEKKCNAIIKLKEKAVVSGLEEAKFLFEFFRVKTKVLAKNGKKYNKGKTLIKLKGSNKQILIAERTALNVLSRMSGIATSAKKAQKIAGKNCKIMLTRKTCAGLNELDKKAGIEAGILPHRKNLNSAFLIKENHLKFGSIQELIQKAKKMNKKNKEKTGKGKQKNKLTEKKLIEVEIQNFFELNQAIKAKPDVIMLDNFSLKNAGKALKEIRKTKIKIEVSGNINFENLREYSSLKPDFISMGLLTHSVKGINLSLLVS